MPALLAPPLSLYVHFPWCVRKCPYCDFNSYTLQGDLQAEPYVARLIRDLEAQAPGVSGRTVVSVFFGGGTPSLFSPEAIARVLGAARAALGRIHSPRETRRAAEELHAAGLSNFNLDLMYALPGQDRAAALRDVEEALALAPAHLSHYQLTLEPGTLFAARPPPLPDEDEAAEMLEDCAATLEVSGFERYEVSAWARPGRQCRHNLNYWSFGDYLGVGAGAHGKLTLPERGEIVRTVQPREPRRYLAARARELTRNPVPAEQLPFEFMLNALRLTGGFAMDEFSGRTGLGPSTIA